MKDNYSEANNFYSEAINTSDEANNFYSEAINTSDEANNFYSEATNASDEADSFYSEAINASDEADNLYVVGANCNFILHYFLLKKLAGVSLRLVFFYLGTRGTLAPAFFHFFNFQKYIFSKPLE